jgi:hypothetical protein
MYIHQAQKKCFARLLWSPKVVSFDAKLHLYYNEFIAMLAGHGLDALNPCSDEETMA